MGYYALIKSGSVQSVIVADQEFINSIGVEGLEVDEIVDVSEDESRPAPGNIYSEGNFSAPE